MRSGNNKTSAARRDPRTPIPFLIPLLILVAGCSFKARSDDYRCTAPADCDPGRTCVDGWCVVDGTTSDASAADAPPNNGADAGDQDAADACPPGCTSCVGTICVIQCPGAGDCAAVTCPSGWDCEVHCDGDGSCTSGVDCSAATNCDIQCTGQGACAGPLECGPGACAVSCPGDASCTGGIDCQNACQCDTTCGGAGSCVPVPTCVPGNQCTDNADMCTSSPGPCSSC